MELHQNHPLQPMPIRGVYVWKSLVKFRIQEWNRALNIKIALGTSR